VACLGNVVTQLRLICLLAVSVFCCGLPATAQVLPVGSPGADGTAPFDTRQEGLYTTAAVVLDGAVLFRVATTGRGDLTAATRALTVDAALQQIVATDPDTGAPAYDPATLGVRVQRGHDRGRRCSARDPLDDRDRDLDGRRAPTSERRLFS
jgi:hypothetical protein